MLITTRKGLPLPAATDPAGTTVNTGRGTVTSGVVRDSVNTLSTIADFFTDFDRDEVITGRWEFQNGILADRGSVYLAQNNTGGARVAGDVVITDPANDTAFILPNANGVDSPRVLVVAEAIANGAVGRVTILGITRLKVLAGTLRGQFLQTTNASVSATGSATVTSGSFAYSLTAPDGANTVLAAVHTGAGGNAATVNNIPAVLSTAPAANSLVSTDATSRLPVAIMPLAIPAADLAGNIGNALLGTDVYRRNQAVNGGQEHWQRGNGPFTVSGVYSSDRWWINLIGTDTLSVSRESTIVDVGSKYSAACTFVLGTGGGGTSFVQSLKTSDGYMLGGRSISVSMRIRTATAGAVRVLIGTDGTGGGNNYSAYQSGSGTFQPLTVSVTPPADATFVNIQVAFSASCTAYVDDTMLVYGVVPADYIAMPPADDLARSLRYYEVCYAELQGYVDATGRSFYYGVPYRVTKSVTPTLTRNGTWTVTNCGQPTPFARTGNEVNGFLMGTTSLAAGAIVFSPLAAGQNVSAESNP